MMFRLSIQNDGYTSTAQQPLNNIARTTIQALASVLAGCQSLATTSYDEALALPTEESVMVALRTQQIIAYESGVADTVDPLGGSYYIEHLTNEIEKGINKYISNINSKGGVLEAIRKGYIQREITESAYEYQKAVDVGEQVVVGVNKYSIKERPVIKLLEIEEGLEQKQIEKLKKLRQKRDNGKVAEALKNIKRVAKSDENIMPVLIEAVKTYATIGEISDVLREVFGEYRDNVTVG